MERRNLLKGIAGAAGMLLGGGTVAKAAEVTAGSPVLGDPQTAGLAATNELVEVPAAEAKALYGPGKLPDIRKALSEQPLKKCLSGAGQDSFAAALARTMAESRQRTDEFFGACLSELEAVRRWNEARGYGAPAAISLPYATEPINLYVRASHAMMQDCPAETLETIALRAQPGGYDFDAHLQALLRRYWKHMASERPDDFLEVPCLLARGTAPKPTRIMTPRATIDICELDGRRLAVLCNTVVCGMNKSLSEFPYQDLQSYGDLSDVPSEVFKLITPIRFEIKRTAFMLEVWAYCEAFGCYGPKAEEWMLAMSPGLTTEQIAAMPRMSQERLQAYQAAHPPAQMQQATQGAPQGKVDVHLTTMQIAKLLARISETLGVPVDPKDLLKT